MRRPLAIDLFCGLGGWTEGLLATGYDVIGFDIERHEYGDQKYPGALVIQDVLTLDGSQFCDSSLIVASPPCQAYSWMAMPWTRAKAKAAVIRADESGQMRADLTRLFDACFRIQREACDAAGRHIPMVVENVRGAQPWVGRARWNFGSFYLWGDVPALMPHPIGAYKSKGLDWSNRDLRGQDFTRVAGGQKFFPRETQYGGASWFAIPPRCSQAREGVKQTGSGSIWFDTGIACLPSSSLRRKAASAAIAKIPLALSRHIGAVYASGAP